MTTLSTHPLDDPDQLALIPDDWTPLAVDLAARFREACWAEATENAGWIHPCRVTGRIKAADPDANMQRVAALWSTACSKNGYLDKTYRPARIDGSVSKGNGNKSTVYRWWRGWGTVTLSTILGTPCHCGSARLPIGASAVWTDGRMYRQDTCFDTDDLETFGAELSGEAS